MNKWNVLDVEPREDFTLIITFARGKKRILDCKKFLLDRPYAQKLKNLDFFMKAKADHLTVAWPDDLDVAPEYLYKNSERMK